MLRLLLLLRFFLPFGLSKRVKLSCPTTLPKSVLASSSVKLTAYSSSPGRQHDAPRQARARVLRDDDRQGARRHAHIVLITKVNELLLLDQVQRD